MATCPRTAVETVSPGKDCWRITKWKYLFAELAEKEKFTKGSNYHCYPETKPFQMVQLLFELNADCAAHLPQKSEN